MGKRQMSQPYNNHIPEKVIESLSVRCTVDREAFCQAKAPSCGGSCTPPGPPPAYPVLSSVARPVICLCYHCLAVDQALVLPGLLQTSPDYIESGDRLQQSAPTSFSVWVSRRSRGGGEAAANRSLVSWFWMVAHTGHSGPPVALIIRQPLSLSCSGCVPVEACPGGCLHREVERGNERQRESKKGFESQREAVGHSTKWVTFACSNFYKLKLQFLYFLNTESNNAPIHCSKCISVNLG